MNDFYLQKGTDEDCEGEVGKMPDKCNEVCSIGTKESSEDLFEWPDFCWWRKDGINIFIGVVQWPSFFVYYLEQVTLYAILLLIAILSGRGKGQSLLYVIEVSLEHCVSFISIVACVLSVV